MKVLPKIQKMRMKEEKNNQTIRPQYRPLSKKYSLQASSSLGWSQLSSSKINYHLGEADLRHGASLAWAAKLESNISTVVPCTGETDKVGFLSPKGKA
jgi:hypothetical protein